ncbi:MAG: hypothetical protein AAB925_02875 [Patescibacteria group bacterium]
MILELYKNILAKIQGFVKSYFYDTIIFIIVALLIMLSFAVGFIIAKYQDKEPIKIEQNN